MTPEDRDKIYEAINAAMGAHGKHMFQKGVLFTQQISTNVDHKQIVRMKKEAIDTWLKFCDLLEKQVKE